MSDAQFAADEERYKRDVLVWNERRKIEATFLNNLGLAFIGVGAITPIVSLLYGLSSAPTAPSWQVVCVVISCIVFGVGFHWAAVNWLEDLI